MSRAQRLTAYALALAGVAWLEQLVATAERAAAAAHTAAHTADEALLEHLLGPCSSTEPAGESAC